MTRRLGSGSLVIATHNAGKLKEISALLEPHGMKCLSAGSLGLPEPAETGTTFVQNAMLKARAAAEASGIVALADDSGLSVAALGGRPGVYTADWAETGNGRDFMMAMTKVNDLVAASGASAPHSAQFCCTLCLAWPDGHDELFEGIVGGQLVWPIRGEGGFGFDPMFLPEGEQETFGEMDPAHKHAMSHRADAFAKLVAGCFDR